MTTVRWLTSLGAGTAVAATITGPAIAAQLMIAAVHSTTGPLAFLGVPAVNGMQLAVDELNAAHYLGDDTIVFEALDDATVTTQTMTLINRAALGDKAIMILGPSDSTRAVAAAPVINDLNVPAITTAQTAASVKPGPWVFKVTTDAAGAVQPLADYASSKLNLKRVASVFLRDNDGQIANMRTFTDGVAKNGVNVVAREGILSSDTDYAAIATKLAGLEIDGIYIGANAEQAANIVLQLKQNGVSGNVKIFGTSSLGDDYIKFGGAAVDNTFMTIDYNPQSPNPVNQAFVATYKKRFGNDPVNYSGVGYTCMILAAHAIKAAQPNPTREKVRDAMLALRDVPVVIGNGKWSNTPSRIPEYGIEVATIKGGKIIAAP